MKPRIARVPSAKLRSSVSMDFSSLQGIKAIKRFCPICFIVYYLSYLCLCLVFFFKDCLRRVNCHLRWVLLGSESLTPTDQSKLRKRQQGRALHWSKQPSVNQSELWSLPKVHKQWYQTELFLDFPGNSILCAKIIKAISIPLLWFLGSQSHSSRNSPATEMSEGVIGRGRSHKSSFSSTIKVLFCCQGLLAECCFTTDWKELCRNIAKGCSGHYFPIWKWKILLTATKFSV